MQRTTTQRRERYVGRNREINETIRRGSGRAPVEESERKQTGVKDVEEMNRAEVVEELPVASRRVAELAARLVDLEESSEVEPVPEEERV
jgi:hypothetical protein